MFHDIFNVTSISYVENFAYIRILLSFFKLAPHFDEARAHLASRL